jgi:hypothetical protein
MINSVESSYLNDEDKEILISIPTKYVHIIKHELNYKIYIYKSEIESYLGFMPLYFKINVTSLLKGLNSTSSESYKNTIVIVLDEKYKPEEFNKLLCNGFYVHGRAGIIDEINYFDTNQDNQIKPTH